MITVKKLLQDKELFFVFVGEHPMAFFYLLRSSEGHQVWAVSGEEEPMAGNVDDFASYDHALNFILSHLKDNG